MFCNYDIEKIVMSKHLLKMFRLNIIFFFLNNYTGTLFENVMVECIIKISGIFKKVFGLKKL